jgi:hypothetical protein
MIEKIENNQLSDLMKGTSKQSAPSTPANIQEDASLQITHESLIQQASQVPSQNFNAVEEAKQLILSGQLDTPENIRAAAESIVKFGI